MPQIGPLEILVVLVIALIVFGPDKLPGMAKSVGRAANELRRMASDVKTEFEDGLDMADDDDSDDEAEAKPTIPIAAAPEPTPDDKPPTS